VIRYKQLITLKIIDQNSKETIGKIEDVIFSKDYKTVDYLIIKNGNLVKNKAIIRYDDIEFINNNQIIYKKDTRQLKEKLERNIYSEYEGSQIFKKEIKDENGECIGFVRDIVINKENGKVDGFIITEGLLEDLIKGRNYLPLLDNIVIDEKAINIRSNILI
jgi:uncharacterized protein YrrD